MLPIFNLVVVIGDELAGEMVGGLGLTNQKKSEGFAFHFVRLEEKTLSVFPEINALEIVVLRGRTAIFLPLPIDFDVLERPIGDSRGNMHSELLEFLILELDVIKLELFLAKFERIVIARPQMLQIAPPAIEHVSTFILTLDHHEKRDIILKSISC